MPFEEFTKDSPTQIVLGLFVPDLVAVFMFHQEGEEFHAHFTSRRDADKGAVLAAAAQLVEWFRANGLQMVAYVSPRAIPLRRFVESAGLVLRAESDFNVFTS